MHNLCESIELHAKARPQHPAIVCVGEQLNYLEFSTRVGQYATALQQQGVKQADLVGIALHDTIDHVTLMFAVMHLGAIIVPIDWRWSTAEKSRLIEHFRVGTVLVEADDELTENQPLDTPGNDTPFNYRLHRIDKQWCINARQQTDQQQKDQMQTAVPPVVRTENLPVVLSLSSGTTGRPSGPLITHGQLFARLHNQLVTLTFNQHDRYLLATPLYFGGGRAFVLSHLVIGATVVLNPPPYSSQELIDTVHREKVSSLFLVPTLLRRLLKEPDESLAKLHQLRVLISSGAPLHAYERKQIQQRITGGFFEYYASTEGGGITVLNPADQSLYPESVGRAAFQVEVDIVDQQHKSVAADEVGQIRYRGPGVATEFFKDEEATSRNFRDGWFYPGDLGRINADGYLFLLGRSKDMIIRGGVNIYPVEIERIIGEFPDITDVAVIALPSDELGEEIAAVIVTRQPVAKEELLAHCQSQLAPYKVPSRITEVDSLPRNSAGKVLKAELAKTLF